MRSPTLLPIRMNAADTSASRAIALWTPLTVVPRSLTTAEIDTFISDVSTTSTNIAMASSSARRRVAPVNSCSGAGAAVVIVPPRGNALRRAPTGPPTNRVMCVACLRRPGAVRLADLPLVAERVADPAQPPTVLVTDRHQLARTRSDRLADNSFRVIDQQERSTGRAVDRRGTEALHGGRRRCDPE